ncbi:hypothetical protein SDC9_53712 [bioreactor metagenome]|uniref:Uncharacterized protein n=1 Tax=bioreactor metagenome TaxID=1076179 RepID=A0A644WTZ7_9ZZZZ
MGGYHLDLFPYPAHAVQSDRAVHPELGRAVRNELRRGKCQGKSTFLHRFGQRIAASVFRLPESCSPVGFRHLLSLPGSECIHHHSKPSALDLVHSRYRPHSLIPGRHRPGGHISVSTQLVVRTDHFGTQFISQCHS